MSTELMEQVETEEAPAQEIILGELAVVNEVGLVVARTDIFALADARIEGLGKYAGAIYDCKDKGGMKMAQEAKRDCTSVRTDLERHRKALTAPLDAVKGMLISEQNVRLARIAVIEGPVEKQISDEKARVAAEAAIAAELARQRAIEMGGKIERLKSAANGLLRSTSGEIREAIAAHAAEEPKLEAYTEYLPMALVAWNEGNEEIRLLLERAEIREAREKRIAEWAPPENLNDADCPGCCGVGTCIPGLEQLQSDCRWAQTWVAPAEASREPLNTSVQGCQETKRSAPIVLTQPRFMPAGDQMRPPNPPILGGTNAFPSKDEIWPDPDDDGPTRFPDLTSPANSLDASNAIQRAAEARIAMTLDRGWFVPVLADAPDGKECVIGYSHSAGCAPATFPGELDGNTAKALCEWLNENWDSLQRLALALERAR